MVYGITRFLCRWIFRLAARVKVSGPPPPGGGVLIVSNHVSHFDPPLLCASCRRIIDFMAMKELYQSRWISAWLEAVHTIATDRRAVDTHALRTAVRRLKAGRVVCIFPEGGLRSGEMSVLGGTPLPAGGAVLSLLAGVPVVPCLITGPDQFYQWKSIFRRPRIRVEWGEAIPAAGNREDLNARIESSLRTMHAVWKTGADYDPVMEARTAQERILGTPPEPEPGIPDRTP